MVTFSQVPDSWTHVKEIANTRLLVSVHHNWRHSANLEVFDVSRKGQAKKIYKFEAVSGSRIIIKIHLIIIVVTGYGDLAYNLRRCFLGAIPVRGHISYHLYSFSSSKAGNTVNLIRKSKWHSHCSTESSILLTFSLIDLFNVILSSRLHHWP